MMKVVNALAVFLLSVLVWGWRLLFSPLVGPACRFQPTCSAYALDALRHHGALKGSYLTLRRPARCHPWGGAGYDPVPDPVPDPGPEADRPGSLPCHHGHVPAAPRSAAGAHGMAAPEPR